MNNRLTLAAAAALLGCAGLAHAEDADAKVRHVLLISVDGMHAQDLARCMRDRTCPHIAELAEHGVTYTEATTPGLSDSVPGLAALVTGGGPISTGLFYDDIYDRTLYPGWDTTCSSQPGVEVFLQEQVGIDNLNGGPLLHLDGGGDFNPQQIPRRKLGADCVPVYPHDFIKTNTIFEVVKKNLPGSHTAWSDKHAWGTDWVNGPSGKGVDDLARTEINSIDPASVSAGNPGGSDYTQSFSGNTATDPAYLHTEVFDNIHLRNVLNQIHGKDSTGAKAAPVPTIFGTNFQTLSVAQKALNSEGGGYVDAAFTPNQHVRAAVAYIDDAIGQIASALKAQHLRNRTLFVLTAKHGQSPADYSRLKKIGDRVSPTLGALVGGGTDPVTGNNAALGSVTTDDVAFIWLADQSQRDLAVHLLQSNTTCPLVDPVSKLRVSGDGICADNGGAVIDLSKQPHKFGNPADGRTPDIMVQPNPGVIFTKSKSKDMEHGGFAPDDGHVALLVSHPGLEHKVVREAVGTKQVAPTIVKALGLKPTLLDAVRKEGTAVLPGLFEGGRLDD
ncbi:alkaline phosphatase family protein [Roseateles sp. BYS78W]|uniref:Alkaline phosphatase family protein n=1 Tax=Pelomonas candidula TaxID=3299025 RepID=A0ABW7HK50_9BURK